MHMLKNKLAHIPLPDLLRSQQQILIVRHFKQILQILEVFASLEPATHALLDDQGVRGASLEVEFEEVSAFVPSE
jgi:hypothetical protein